MYRLFTITIILTLVLFCQTNVLGQNLVTNGDFTNWTGTFPNEVPDNWNVSGGPVNSGNTVTESSGQVHWISNGTGLNLFQNDVMLIDNYYIVTFDITSWTSGSMASGLSGGGNYSISGSGSYTQTFKATSTTIWFSRSGSGDFIFDDVVLELASIEVTVPNGGESWQAGTSQTINWTDNIDENVKIELFKDGVFDSEIVASTSSDGSYVWTVPNIASTDYMIKITDVSNSNILDFSDQTFTIGTDFEVDLLVCDNCGNCQNLIFGTNDDATDCFDPFYDLFAPPPAPSGAFDSRLISCSEQFIKDIRATNLDSIMIWDIEYQVATGCDNTTFSWDPGQLPAEGNFVLIDFATGGSLVSIDMRTNNSYTDIMDLGHLQIYFNYTVIINTDITDGFNMVSLPLEVEDNFYKALYPNAIDGTLFGFDGSYYSSDTVNVEEGYWLRFGSPEVVNYEGIEISLMDLDLISGWNMIGGPACDIALSSVVDPGGIIIPGTMFGFDGSYISTDTFTQGIGYWIRTNASGTITLDCSAAANLTKGSNNESFLIDLTEFNTVEIEDSRGNAQSLYFGGKLGEDLSIENYSLPPLPLPGLFDVRIPGGYRLSESDEIEIEIQSDNYPLKVKMTGKNDGSAAGYLIKEFAGNVEVGEREISDGMEIIISNENVNLLKLQLSSIIPARFVLEQNYPNPFNPVTNIKYALPVKANVILKVYNSIGQEIRSLVSEEKPAGSYEVEFSALGGSASGGDTYRLASGIYFYHLKAVNLSTGIGEVYVETKKMILLK